MPHKQNSHYLMQCTCYRPTAEHHQVILLKPMVTHSACTLCRTPCLAAVMPINDLALCVPPIVCAPDKATNSRALKPLSANAALSSTALAVSLGSLPSGSAWLASRRPMRTCTHLMCLCVCVCVCARALVADPHTHHASTHLMGALSYLRNIKLGEASSTIPEDNLVWLT